MTTKTFSLIGLALLLLPHSTYTAPQKEINAKIAKTTSEKAALNKRTITESQAFAIIGFYKNMPTSTPTINEQSLALLEKSLVFNAPIITERYTQPTKFVYNPKTEKFESRVISLTDAALKP